MGVFSRLASWNIQRRQHEHNPQLLEALGRMGISLAQPVLDIVSTQNDTRHLVALAIDTKRERNHSADNNIHNNQSNNKHDNNDNAAKGASRRPRHYMEYYRSLHCVVDGNKTAYQKSKQLCSSGEEKVPRDRYAEPPCSHTRYSDYWNADMGEQQYEDPCKSQVPQPMVIAPCYPFGVDYSLGTFWDDNLVCQTPGTPIMNLIPPPEDCENVRIGKQGVDVWPGPSLSPPHGERDKYLLHRNRYQKCQRPNRHRATPADLQPCPESETRLINRDIPVPAYFVGYPHGANGGTICTEDSRGLRKDNQASLMSPTASDYLTKARDYPRLTYDGEGWGDAWYDFPRDQGTVDKDYLPATGYNKPNPPYSAV